jgi:flagellar motor protein MotB
LRVWRFVVLIALLLLAGCQNGQPFLGGQQLGNQPPPGTPGAIPNLSFENGIPQGQPLLGGTSPEAQALSLQMQEAQRKLVQFDSVNRELTARVAQAEQYLQNEREQKRLIQQQLADAGSRLKEALAAKDEAVRQASSLYAAQQTLARPVGGATITANNSIRTSLKVADVAGLEVRQEGTTIRVEVPADRLFAPGTMQLSAQAPPLLESIAAAIARHYPRQLVVVEGHTDVNSNNPQAPATSHQVAAAQAHAVVDYFLSRNLLPAAQLSSMSFGSHRPRVSNATPQGQAKNRRLELVIYPDTLDGKP